MILLLNEQGGQLALCVMHVENIFLHHMHTISVGGADGCAALLATLETTATTRANISTALLQKLRLSKARKSRGAMHRVYILDYLWDLVDKKLLRFFELPEGSH